MLREIMNRVHRYTVSTTSLFSCSSKKKASIIHGSLSSFAMFQMDWESWKQLYLIKQKPWRLASSGTRSSSILSSRTATHYQDWLGSWEATCVCLVTWVFSLIFLCTNLFTYGIHMPQQVCEGWRTAWGGESFHFILWGHISCYWIQIISLDKSFPPLSHLANPGFLFNCCKNHVNEQNC